MKDIEELIGQESFFPVMLSPAMIRGIIDYCQLECEQLKALIQARVFDSHISAEVLVQNFKRFCDLELICLKALAEFDIVDLADNAEQQKDVQLRIHSLFKDGA